MGKREQINKTLRGTGILRQNWGTGNNKKMFFYFCGIEEQAIYFRQTREQGHPLTGPQL